jgi:multiple sugar transport system substrate-binding protein
MTNPLAAKRLSRRGALKLAGGAALLGAFSGPLAACAVPGMGGAQKMTIWADATFAPASDDYQTKVIQDWGKSKNVEIELTREPGADIDKKLQAAIESKQFPDMSAADGGRYIKYFPSNAFLDITDLYAEIGKQWGGFYKVADQTATQNGKQGILPFSIDSSLILYRTDLLQQAGLQPPKTWDELFDQAAKLQKPPELYGVGFQLNPAGTDAENTFYHMGLSFGAMPVSDDGKTPKFNSPEMVKLVTYYKQQWDRGVFPPGVTGWDNSANNVNYQEGRVAFINNPASPLVWARDNKPEMLPKMGVSAMPAGPSGKSYTSAYVRDGWVMFNGVADAKRDLVKDLIRHLMSKEHYTKWMELAFPAPALNGLENLDIWKDPKRGGFLEAAKTGILGGYPGPQTPAWAEFGTRTPYINMMARVIVEKWEPQRAVEEQDKVMKDIYAKHFK